MIFNTVLDPAIFAAEHFTHPYYEALLFERLHSFIYGHRLVVDEGGIIGSALFNYFSANQELNRLFSSLLDNEMIVRIPVEFRDESRRNDGHYASRVALALTQNEYVDLLIADEMTLEKIKQEQADAEKILTLKEFPRSKMAKTEIRQRVIEIGGFTCDKFVGQVIRPTVRCARKVTIIDKIIIRAAFGDQNDPKGNPSANWSNFKTSIQAVYDEWAKGLYKGNGIFEIITWPATHVMRNGKSLLGDNLAQELGERLGIPLKHLRIMFKSAQAYRADMHDRYLVTNQGVVLGFSKGFELIDDNVLSTCDVYLRKPDALISKLMSPTNNCGMLEPNKR